MIVENKLLIIVPAHNEYRTIYEVVRSLVDLSFNVLVVDDASEDDTAQLAIKAGAQVLPLVNNLGAWGATQTGLRYAEKHSFELVLTMDADGQHIPDTIPEFIHRHEQSNADVSVGAFLERGSIARRFAWRFFRKLSRLKVADLTSGLRIYNKRAISLLSSQAASLVDYQDVGVLLILNHSGLQINEVPVKMEARSEGKSRIFGSWWQVFTYMLHTTILCLTKLRFSRELNNAN